MNFEKIEMKTNTGKKLKIAKKIRDRLNNRRIVCFYFLLFFGTFNKSQVDILFVLCHPVVRCGTIHNIKPFVPFKLLFRVPVKICNITIHIEIFNNIKLFATIFSIVKFKFQLKYSLWGQTFFIRFKKKSAHQQNKCIYPM